ncbi:MAG: cupin domain-containing protein [Rhodobacteraceae bacterium]|nr:cupin domain-containing protein [Paracoccaceae bacterium]
MPRLDITAAPVRTGSIYPGPYAARMAGRTSHRLGDLAGLTQFGVNIVTLEPGALASLRHWHLNEDEFAIVLSGELVLVEDTGETEMRPGDCAAWKAGVPVGHHLVNRSSEVASFLVVGTRAPAEIATYTEVDMIMHLEGGTPRFTHHDGSEWREPRDLAPRET